MNGLGWQIVGSDFSRLSALFELTFAKSWRLCGGGLCFIGVAEPSELRLP